MKRQTSWRSQNVTQDRRGRMVRRVASAIGLAALLALTVESPAIATPSTTTYVYDAAGRIISASYISGSTVYIISYSYDAAGNRTYTVTSTAGVWGGFNWGAAKW